MPLRAFVGQECIYAFDFDDQSWLDLKQSYRTRCLRMPCCESAAIPKTSKLGNFFFSHTKRGECTSAPESAEHIYLKTIIAKAAKSAGWSVTTEWAGQTPDGERWVADVYCEKGNAQITIEVQLSHQSREMLVARQQAYASSGVRAAWLASEKAFKADYLPERREIPVFRVSDFAVGEEPVVTAFGIGVYEFVIGMLSKKLRWESTPFIYHIYYMRDACWKCCREVKQVYGYGIDVHEQIAKTVPNMSSVLSQFSKFISNDELKALGLNVIGSFGTLKGNAPGSPYCNVCIHCGAPQNNYYAMKKLAEQQSHGGDALGVETFVSTRDFSGAWRYDRSLPAP